MSETESSRQQTSLPGPWHWTDTETLTVAGSGSSGGKSATACHTLPHSRPGSATLCSGRWSRLWSSLQHNHRSQSCRHHQRQHPPTPGVVFSYVRVNWLMNKHFSKILIIIGQHFSLFHTKIKVSIFCYFQVRIKISICKPAWYQIALHF